MEKPRLSFWQIWNMSFGFLGIQFGFALQNANVSRIFETLGAKVDAIPILWIAAPVTGLIVQPIIGYMSDRTWGKLGRRRPYFLSGAILASLALLIMPNSPVLWVAAGMLWIMDASINISMEPFRAFVGDMLPSEQRTMGFSMQSFFIGTGAIVASALPYIMTTWFNVPNTAAQGQVPLSVKLSFYIGGGVFFLAVLWTVFSTKEYTPEQLAKYNEEHGSSTLKHKNTTDISTKTNFIRNGAIWFLFGAIVSIYLFIENSDLGLYVLFVGAAIFGVIQIIVGVLIRQKKTQGGFVTVINDLYTMPSTMRQLAFVQFFSWFALFSMWIYTTPAVTSTLYDMKMNTEMLTNLYNSLKTNEMVLPADKKDDAKSVSLEIEKDLNKGMQNPIINLEIVKFFLENQKTIKLTEAEELKLNSINKEFNTGADWVGVLMAVYNGFAAVMAFILIWLANRTSRKMVHFISLIIGGLSLVSFYIIKDPNILLVSELGIGLAWASILAMPYAILAGSLPPEKMGVYMGIFNFFIVIPQITAAAILGWFVKNLFGGESIFALLLGGFSFVVAALLVMFVKDVDEVKSSPN